MDSINTVEDVYNRLRGMGELEWIGASKSAAVIYFEHGRRRYKIYFDDSNVEVSVQRRLFRQSYWDSIASRRYVNPEDGPKDVYDTVVWAIKEDTGHNQ